MMDRELTADQREALTILQEECAEVIHDISKMLRHGPTSRNPDAEDSVTNSEAVQRELAQLITVLSVCYASGLFKEMNDFDSDVFGSIVMKAKMESLRKYSTISAETLDKVEV